MRENRDLKYTQLLPENKNMDEIMVHFLIDISGSMKPYIHYVNNMINWCIEELQGDKIASKMVETAITTFSDEAYLYQSYRPITRVNKVNLTAGGGTRLGSALTDTVQLLKERGNELVNNQEMTIRTPFIFLITDGDTEDNITEAARIIKERTNEGKLQLWTLGIGDYGRKTIQKLHPDGARWIEVKEEQNMSEEAKIELTKKALKEFFEKVVTASVKAVSVKHVGQKTEFKNPLSDENSTLRAGVDSWLLN